MSNAILKILTLQLLTYIVTLSSCKHNSSSNDFKSNDNEIETCKNPQSDEECLAEVVANFKPLVENILKNYPKLAWIEAAPSSQTSQAYALDQEESLTLLQETQLLKADVNKLRQKAVGDQDTLAQLEKRLAQTESMLKRIDENALSAKLKHEIRGQLASTQLTIGNISLEVKGDNNTIIINNGGSVVTSNQAPTTPKTQTPPAKPQTPAKPVPRVNCERFHGDAEVCNKQTYDQCIFVSVDQYNYRCVSKAGDCSAFNVDANACNKHSLNRCIFTQVDQYNYACYSKTSPCNYFSKDPNACKNHTNGRCLFSQLDAYNYACQALSD